MNEMRKVGLRRSTNYHFPDPGEVVSKVCKSSGGGIFSLGPAQPVPGFPPPFQVQRPVGLMSSKIGSGAKLHVVNCE